MCKQLYVSVNCTVLCKSIASEIREFRSCPSESSSNIRAKILVEISCFSSDNSLEQKGKFPRIFSTSTNVRVP